METTVTLTPENAAIVAQYGELTGFTQEELTNWFLADYFGMFDDEDQSFINETIGSMYFKDRKSAERVQTWLIKRLEKKGYFLDGIETEINSNPDGTFDVRLSVPAPWRKAGATKSPKNNPASSPFRPDSRNWTAWGRMYEPGCVSARYRTNFHAKTSNDSKKRARKLGLTPSQLLESIITGKPPEEVKGFFIRPSWPKLPQGNIKRSPPDRVTHLNSNDP
jgi:hypothetical protein